MQDNKQPPTYELYRQTILGLCLTDTLDELTKKQSMTPQLAARVLEQFDKSITEALSTKVKANVTFKGSLHTYRLVDNVWTFILTDSQFRTESETLDVGCVKIVACDGSVKET
eukprot:TRINITY_DN7275_c0_g1_i1.p1 TRINITY_DN7275_c0_g1~~TRINITY_DN7275_c0_g1_i1.p1  ORF type:complete len:113 (+),score=6.12 TRINITY_DN7275_c0_g1_i1:112-450(+)